MKKLKIVLIFIACLVGCYFTYNFFTMIKYSHGIEMDDYEPYMWIFQDSIRKDVDTSFFAGHIREKDILYQYRLKNKYLVSIWELKDLSKIQLGEIPINSNVDLSNVQISPSESLNKNVTPEITVELGFSLDSTISLNLDTNSKIITTIETPNYRGFYAEVNILSISNEKGKHIIQLDYPYENPYTVFLFYKTQRSFYIIFIKAKEKVPLDEHVIQYLDLS